MYLAMWSGPRNISTAMMRSWAQRSDTWVIDEPFYAYYLKETGLEHPGAPEIIQSQPTDWETVVRNITGPIPNSRTIYYQKHITTHMLPSLSLDWLSAVSNVFLIREPESVVPSYSQCRPETAAEDLGYAQQVRLFNYVTNKLKQEPVVIESSWFLQNPEHYLQKICENLSIEFQPSMLAWSPGIRETDGVWHPHWYTTVSESTGFNPAVKKDVILTPDQQDIVDLCRPAYDQMLQQALT